MYRYHITLQQYTIQYKYVTHEIKYGKWDPHSEYLIMSNQLKPPNLTTMCTHNRDKDIKREWKTDGSKSVNCHGQVEVKTNIWGKTLGPHYKTPK